MRATVITSRAASSDTITSLGLALLISMVLPSRRGELGRVMRPGILHQQLHGLVAEILVLRLSPGRAATHTPPRAPTPSRRSRTFQSCSSPSCSSPPPWVHWPRSSWSCLVQSLSASLGGKGGITKAGRRAAPGIHQRLDDSPQGADFLFRCTHAGEHGAHVLHHAGALLGRA